MDRKHVLATAWFVLPFAFSAVLAAAEDAIGVFDSGTGGLTVLEKLLVQDDFDNATGRPGKDGIPDFAGERFVYFADSANMSYGVYPSEGKADYLRELVRGDAAFLLGSRYFRDAAEKVPSGVKPGAKIVVIACNTGTAYGLGDVRQMLAGTDKTVIGVIGAGAKAALDAVGKGPAPRAIGVLATRGTVSSGAYARTIRAEAAARGAAAGLAVVNQPGYGLSEAVDRVQDFFDDTLSAPRDAYRGPRLGTGDGAIDPALLATYGFDFTGHKMLVSRQDDGTFAELQINDPENYVRYNFVSLVERHRASGSGAPLRAVILGCTHFPFLTAQLAACAQTLRRDPRYRDLIAPDLVFIDPALYTARECYLALRAAGKLARDGGAPEAEGYISVPDAAIDPKNVGRDGRLTYAFKYSRKVGDPTGTKAVPFSRQNVDPANLERLRRLTPAVYRALVPKMDAPAQGRCERARGDGGARDGEGRPADGRRAAGACGFGGRP